MNDVQSIEESRTLTSWSRMPQLVCHQIAWWACVIWMGLVGPAVMLAFLTLHFVLIRGTWAVDLRLVAVSTVVGLAVDNSLALTGSVSYVGVYLIGACPLWLVAIWAGFGATLKHSQSLFVRSPMHALATGFIGGPLAYWGGERLQRMTVHSLGGWLMVSLTWGLALAVLFFTAQGSKASVRRI